MNTVPIVVGVDGSPSSQRAVRWAARDAAKRNVRLILVPTVTPPVLCYDEGLGIVPNIFDCSRDARDAVLTEALVLARESTRDGGCPRIDIDGRGDRPEATLLEHSRAAHLIVLGARGVGGGAGTLVRAVASRALCPVIVVRQRLELPLLVGPVVLGVNRAESSASVVTAAFEEASLRGAELVVAHGWGGRGDAEAAKTGGDSLDWSYELDEYSALSDDISTWVRRYPQVRVRQIVFGHSPVRGLLEYAADSQLLVVGRRRRRGLARLSNSTSKALLRRLDRPLMIVQHS